MTRDEAEVVKKALDILKGKWQESQGGFAVLDFLAAATDEQYWMHSVVAAESLVNKHLVEVPGYAGGCTGGRERMHLSIHVPLFGSKTVESKPIECPVCPRGMECGVNDWIDRDISTCDPGDVFVCGRCGKHVIVNWGLVEPDHLSNWKNSEHCPHRLCVLMRSALRDG